jgi:hypothetical protein
VVVAYLAKGRMKLPKDAVVFNVDDLENGPGHLPGRNPVEQVPAGDPPAAAAGDPPAVDVPMR